jgi:hypothetical protein
LVSQDDLNHAGRVVFDLGEVEDADDVRANGVDVGQLVAQPFSLDIRPLLRSGDDVLEVIVANSLNNRASTVQWMKNWHGTMPHYPPISSGLLGPVLLEYEK